MAEPYAAGAAVPAAAAPRGSRPLDGVWLAIGTLTALRVPAPSAVDARAARTAMLLAPLAGLLPAGTAGVVVYLGDRIGLGILLSALLALGTAALLTRGLHLDGLADTADGLAAGYDRAKALAVMRRGDVGPAGAVTLVLVLAVQTAAILRASEEGRGPVVAAAATLVGLGAGRLALTLACVRGVPSARPDGLGAAVAGTVPAVGLAVVTACAATGSAVLTSWLGLGPVPGLAAVGAALVAAGILLARSVVRLGGVTGDVLGACVEVGATAALVTFVAVLGAA